MNHFDSKDLGANRLFYAIVVVSAINAQGCGESGATQGTASDGSAGGAAGAPASAMLSVPAAGAAGARSDSMIADRCPDPDQFRCTTRAQTDCVCDPTQPTSDADCPAGSSLFCERPLGCACGTNASSADACPNPAQFLTAQNGVATACDPLAPTSAADCVGGTAFTCSSYDPPTSCACYRNGGILVR